MMCLDSDCIIEFLRGNKEAVEIVQKYLDSLVTTEINVFEVFYGIYIHKNFSKAEEEHAQGFFNTIEVLPFAKPMGKLSAEIAADLIKNGKQIEQNDSLIAAILLQNGVQKIITRNHKHFSRIRGLDVLQY